VAIQYTSFLPNRSINTESTSRNYFTSLRKVWLSLGWYLCTYTPLLGHKLMDGWTWFPHRTSIF